MPAARGGVEWAEEGAGASGGGKEALDVRPGEWRGGVALRELEAADEEHDVPGEMAPAIASYEKRAADGPEEGARALVDVRHDALSEGGEGVEQLAQC